MYFRQSSNVVLADDKLQIKTIPMIDINDEGTSECQRQVRIIALIWNGIEEQLFWQAASAPGGYRGL